MRDAWIGVGRDEGAEGTRGGWGGGLDLGWGELDMRWDGLISLNACWDRRHGNSAAFKRVCLSCLRIFAACLRRQNARPQMLHL